MKAAMELAKSFIKCHDLTSGTVFHLVLQHTCPSQGAQNSADDVKIVGHIQVMRQIHCGGNGIHPGPKYNGTN